MQRTITRVTMALGLALALALGTGRALAATNYWSDLGSGYSGNYTNIDTAPHWTTNGVAAGVPTTTDVVAFTNKQQSAAYTVQFTSSQTNGALNVWDDAVNFDLNGNIYKGNGAGWYTYAVIGDTQTVATSVKFFSTSDTNVVGGNTARLSTPNVLGYAYLGPKGGDVHLPNITRNTTITVDDSGGFPVTLEGSMRYFTVRDANFIISGSGTVVRATYEAQLNGNVVVSDGALLDVKGYVGRSSMLATTTVNNATLKTGYLTLASGSPGWSSEGTLILTNNALWTASGDVKVGNSRGGSAFTGEHSGKVLIDGSTFVGQRMDIGGYGDYWGVGKVEVRNGSSVTLSNGLYLNATNWIIGSVAMTNTLVLNGSTIRLGGAVPGTLTNQGIMRASGTITGLGASPALVYTGPSGTTGAVFEVGSSIGTLTLNNVDLELAPGSETFWEFSDTGSDQIILNGGSASVLGSNLFSLAAGAPAPAPGAAYGQNIYDFITGPNITWNPQYSDLTNLLASYGLVQGLDYNFGVIDIGGGLQGLRLQFIPEPSTVLLLVVGGFLLWKVRGKRPSLGA